MKSSNNRLVVAEIARPRGNRGELLARSQTDVPGRLERLKRAHAHLTDGSDVEIEINQAWVHKGDWIFKFAGVDSIGAAERFRGADLWIPENERGELPEGDFFESDLIGCAVIDRLTGQTVGRVEGFERYGGPPLMKLAVAERKLLIPFVKSLTQVDLAARIIRVDVPEGLLDL
ncbi:MAG TPA: ribosome maturation factor RimM [Bryobacteraceae bacterium]